MFRIYCLRASVWFIGCIVLTSCGVTSKRSGGYYQDDGPPNDSEWQVIQNTVDAKPKKLPLSASGNVPYTVFGKRYVPVTRGTPYQQRGTASWYGKKYHGRKTSSGEEYNMYAMTAAHTTLPLPSFVRVTNLDNQRRVIVKVNDRGPFLNNRLIDLSYVAAAKLGIIGFGTGRVDVELLDPEQWQYKQSSKFDDQELITRQALPVKVPAQNTAPVTLSVDQVVIQVAAFSNRQNAMSAQTVLLDNGLIEPSIKSAGHDGVVLHCLIGWAV